METLITKFVRSMACRWPRITFMKEKHLDQHFKASNERMLDKQIENMIIGIMRRI